jgi:hypothetical protein
MIISGLSAAIFMLHILDEDGQSTSAMALVLAVAAGLFVGSGLPTGATETFGRATTHLSKLADKAPSLAIDSATIESLK